MADFKRGESISQKLTTGSSITFDIRSKVRIVLTKRENGDIDINIEDLPDENPN